MSGETEDREVVGELEKRIDEWRVEADKRDRDILTRMVDHVFKLAPRPDADILVVTLPHAIDMATHQRIGEYLREHFKPKFPNLVTLVVEKDMKVDLISRRIVEHVADARDLVRDLAHMGHRDERVTIDGVETTIHARDCEGCRTVMTPEWQERLHRFLEGA